MVLMLQEPTGLTAALSIHHASGSQVERQMFIQPHVPFICSLVGMFQLLLS
jgi:hypothetical protein